MLDKVSNLSWWILSPTISSIWPAILDSNLRYMTKTKTEAIIYSIKWIRRIKGIYLAVLKTRSKWRSLIPIFQKKRRLPTTLYKIWVNNSKLHICNPKVSRKIFQRLIEIMKRLSCREGQSYQSQFLKKRDQFCQMKK